MTEKCEVRDASIDQRKVVQEGRHWRVDESDLHVRAVLADNTVAELAMIEDE